MTPKGAHFLVKTVEEWEAVMASCGLGDTLVLQIGASWCQHCGPVGEAIELEKDRFQFKFGYSDAADSELVEHFACSKLPTLIFYSDSNKECRVVESMRVGAVRAHIEEHCQPKLVLDADF